MDLFDDGQSPPSTVPFSSLIGNHATQHNNDHTKSKTVQDQTPITQTRHFLCPLDLYKTKPQLPHSCPIFLSLNCCLCFWCSNMLLKFSLLYWLFGSMRKSCFWLLSLPHQREIKDRYGRQVIKSTSQSNTILGHYFKLGFVCFAYCFGLGLWTTSKHRA